MATLIKITIHFECKKETKRMKLFQLGQYLSKSIIEDFCCSTKTVKIDNHKEGPNAPLPKNIK